MMPQSRAGRHCAPDTRTNARQFSLVLTTDDRALFQPPTIARDQRRVSGRYPVSRCHGRRASRRPAAPPCPGRLPVSQSRAAKTETTVRDLIGEPLAGAAVKRARPLRFMPRILPLGTDWCGAAPRGSVTGRRAPLVSLAKAGMDQGAARSRVSACFYCQATVRCAPLHRWKGTPVVRRGRKATALDSYRTRGLGRLKGDTAPSF